MSQSSLYATLPFARSIRLLRLHPGADNERLSCSLEVVADSSSSPRYHALSYCWGDANDLTELTCNGEAFAVTKNLYAALHCLRRKNQPDLVWADAICINQDDIPERNQQVSIMNKIYQQATRVFVWAGPGNEDTVEVLAMIRNIAHRIHDRCDPGGSIATWLSTLSAEYGKGKMISEAYPVKAGEFSRAQWRSFWHFYQAGWFFRVWVVQEVRQTLDIWLLCGDLEIEWDLIALSASWAWLGAIHNYTAHWKKELFTSYDGFINAKFMWDKTLVTRRQAPFLALLHLARPLQSTDPRDKVFAMIHHVISQDVVGEHGQLVERRHHPMGPQDTRNTHLDFRADYGMSTYEVYREVAVQSLQQYQNPEVLCYAWQTAHYSSSWPSWIPRWDISNNQPTPVLLPFLYDAARGSNLEYHLNATVDSLSMRGLNLGSLVDTTSVLRYPAMNSHKTGLDSGSVEKILLDMSRRITRDHWQLNETSETVAARSHSNLQAQLTNFSSYVLRLLQNRKEDSYISFDAMWCDTCKHYISGLYGEASSTSSKFYHCNICSNGVFDLCTSCYQRGERCKVPSHKMRKLESTSVWIPYADEVIEKLKAHAVGGKWEWIHDVLTQSCNRVAFFKTSRGWHGSASMAMETGDMVVILFGSRVPFVLRKHGSVYRLVSDCYVDGLMDGEAIDMWKDGKLESEEFEIR